MSELVFDTDVSGITVTLTGSGVTVTLPESPTVSDVSGSPIDSPTVADILATLPIDTPTVSDATTCIRSVFACVFRLFRARPLSSTPP